jgi:hypothetical protein
MPLFLGFYTFLWIAGGVMAYRGLVNGIIKRRIVVAEGAREGSAAFINGAGLFLAGLLVMGISTILFWRVIAS